MAILFSELVHFVPNPAETANKMVEAFGWEIIETYEESWILLKTPGDGKIGYMRHVAETDKPWPHPITAFRSDQIEADVADLKAKGLEIPDVKKSPDIWHSTYVDPHGNKFMIWQEPQK